MSEPQLEWNMRLIALKRYLYGIFPAGGKQGVDQLILTLEVNVEGAGGYPGLFGNVAHRNA